tara:strand:- start:219 stop:947 length:729 start_codon:yes stop_codon:yes gene_type:complete
MKFGFLTTLYDPLLPLNIVNAIQFDIKQIVVICDPKHWNEKDQLIWKKRTNGIIDYNNGEIVKKISKKKLPIPFYFVNSHNSKQTLNLIKKLNIKCLFACGTPRRLSKKIINSTKYGIINCHPGYLPSYRGCTNVEWAIYNNDKVGNSVHFLDEGYDTGPIILKEYYYFTKKDSYQTIRVKVYRRGARLAAKAMKLIKEKKISFRNMQSQKISDGKFWVPISDYKYKQVLKKIKLNKYKYIK